MFIKDYLSRHTNNINRILHIIGVPQAFFGLFQIITGKPAAGMINLFLGYLWQWLGHTYFEKNEVGEVILIKKLIKKLRRNNKLGGPEP